MCEPHQAVLCGGSVMLWSEASADALLDRRRLVISLVGNPCVQHDAAVKEIPGVLMPEQVGVRVGNQIGYRQG